MVTFTRQKLYQVISLCSQVKALSAIEDFGLTYPSPNQMAVFAHINLMTVGVPECDPTCTRPGGCANMQPTRFLLATAGSLRPRDTVFYDPHLLSLLANTAIFFPVFQF